MRNKKPARQLDPLCRAVKRVRQKLGETQEAFARRLGVAVMTVSKFETGHSIPKDQDILKSLSGVAHSADCFEESLQFGNALRTDRRAPAPSKSYELRAYSLAQWRLMAAARTVAAIYPERIPALEEALGPALQTVNSVLEGGVVVFGEDYQHLALRDMNVIGDYWAQKIEEQEKRSGERDHH